MAAMQAIESDRKLSKEIVIEALQEALAKAFRKHIEIPDAMVRVDVNDETGDIKVYQQRLIVENVEDDELEISLEDAKRVNQSLELGGVVEEEVSIADLGRAAVILAKNVMKQKIREAEKLVVYEEYCDKVDEMITGTIESVEEKFCVVNIGKTLALMPKNQQIPNEQYREGELIRVIIKEVNKETKGAQVLVSRADATLVKRYKETRRTHPLSRDTNLLDGIDKERELLKPIRDISDVTIDTTGLAAKDLKQQIITKFGDLDSDYFSVTFMSFGFKHGTPIDTDIMFDVRFLPNPFYIETLRPQTGLDDGVYEYVMSFEETTTFLAKLVDLLQFLIPKYKAEGKSQVIIGIGCTGGQHRSVAIAEYLAHAFENDYKTNSKHRDIHRAHKK